MSTFATELAPEQHARARTLTRARALPAWLPAAGIAAAVGLAPFERLAPLVSLPLQKISNTEVVLLVAIAVAARTMARDWRSWWQSPLAAPALAWVAVVMVAALASPFDVANASKAAGRIAIGLLVCRAALSSLTTPGRIAGVSAVALAAATVVAVFGILEVAQVPWALDWLRQFRRGVHVVGGEVRLTSTLQYPTIAAMYLEIAFALGLGLLFQAIDVKRKLLAWTIAAALLVVTHAIVLTLTRAALGTLLAVLGTSAALRWRQRGWDPGLRALGWLSAAVAAIVLWGAIGGPLVLRFRAPDEAQWYRAEFQVPASLQLATSERTRVSVEVENTGRVTWRSDASPPFHLAYHWLGAEGSTVLKYDGLRTPFAEPVPPGGRATIAADVEAPPRAGSYRIVWDVVLEHRLWFGLRGSAPAMTPVTVFGDLKPAPMPAPMEMPRRPPRLGRLALWRIGVAMLVAHPWLGVGPDNFRLLYGEWAGVPGVDPRVHTNNTYLEVFVGAGLIGGVLFLWLLWRFAGTLRRAWPRIDLAHQPLFIGAIAAVVAIAVHGLLDSFLTFTPTYVPIWVVAAMTLACIRQPKDA